MWVLSYQVLKAASRPATASARATIRHFPGAAVDEVVVYDRALSPEEIRTLSLGAQPPLSGL